MGKKPVVIDACCMLNLLATRREVVIVQALDLLLIDTEYVSRESLFLSTAPDEDGVRGKQSASTAALRAAGHLETRALDTDALVDAFVNCATLIIDTDASCIALAGVLNVPLVTDDRKLRRIAIGLFPQVELVSTLDLVHDAAKVLRWDREELVKMATNLRWAGNFVPPKRDPRGQWYLDLLRRAGVPNP